MAQFTQFTQQQKQIALAAAVVVVAIGLGYTLGKRPAATTSQPDTMPNQNPAATVPEGSPEAPLPAGTQPSTTGTAPKPAATSTAPAPKPPAGEPIAPPAKAGLISLAAKSANGGISFNWSMPSNLTSPFGYVMYKSTTSAPSFPRDEAKFIADPNARTYTWDIQDGKTYYFKMCTWNGKATTQSGCLTTSNAVKAVAPTASASQQQNPFDYTATELGLAGRVESDGVRLFWSQSTTANFVSYKVVRSATDTNPYYPNSPVVATMTGKTDVGTFDTSAVKGAKYWYRVCVVRSNANPQCGNVWQVQF